MARAHINAAYTRMGRTMTRIFGNPVLMRPPGADAFVPVDAVVSAGYGISPIQGESSQTRNLPTISLRRAEVLSLMPPGAEILPFVQRSVFLYEGREYRMDDATDDTKIFVEGFLARLSAPAPGASGDSVITKKKTILR